MPFKPLPRILQADVDLLASTHSFGLDIGCGDGRLGHKLQRDGLRILGLDRFAGSLASGADVVGEARALPVPVGGLDLILAANLVRHLLPEDPGGGFLQHWFSALRSGGIIYIFEDRPDRSIPGRRNFADLQDFLARVTGQGRGPLLQPRALDALLAALPAEVQVQRGTGCNLRRPDSGPVLDMLAGSAGHATGTARRLIKSISRFGLEYGDYWWVRVARKGD